MRIAIVTGASSGLGMEFVKNLESEDIEEIWVIARRKERLEMLSQISSLPIRPIALDLTKSENIDWFEKYLEKEKPHIHILINAAGFGKIGAYDEISREDVDNMIDLNCKAAVDMTLISLPYMSAGDRILEICSTAAFQPFQFLNVYAASKSFLYRFTRALRYELWNRKIYVTAVCPYWVKDTEFIPTAKKTQGSRRIKHFFLASKKKSVAKIALLDSKHRLPVSTPGIMCTVHRIVAKFIPSFIMCHIWDLLRIL